MDARVRFVEWLREYVPDDEWESFWWMAPAATIVLLPSGYILLRVLGYAGWTGVGRAAQGLMLFSVASGLIVGALVLWSCGEAGLGRRSLVRARRAAWLALLMPALTILTMFAVANML